MTPEISFEFFPPRTDRIGERMRAAARQLADTAPIFYSVTYGASGSSRDVTPDTVAQIRAQTGIGTAPHIAALGSERKDIEALLEQYTDAGVDRLVVVRGDTPQDDGPPTVQDSTLRHGSDLVALIRELTGERFTLYVGAYPERHPEASSLHADVEQFAQKIRCGADAAVTQYFYNADAYENFLELSAAAGVKVPIIAGIMPIYDFAQISRFSATCGAEIPRWLQAQMAGLNSPEAQRDYAADMVASLCERLVKLGVPGFHFYTLNRAEPTLAVLQRAGLVTA
jgi:methylenetetrahydrofolate reductase (NADPH)